MNPIVLLGRPAEAALTEEEEALITRLLVEAYRMDESSATNPEVKRLVEKVRQRMENPDDPCGPG